MNVYDFDNTIYAGDSTIDFYFFCLKKHPKIILRIPKQLLATVWYKCGRITKTKIKEVFLGFLKDVSSVQQLVENFWSENQHKVKVWYLRQQEKEDLIISASPDFLLREICDRVKIDNLIASDIDERIGMFFSENCYGTEKGK